MKKKRPAIDVADTCDDDEEAVDLHSKELEKEAAKKKFDDEKVTRLLSLTYARRRRTMLRVNASTRINETLMKYPFFKKPIFVKFCI